ncbi:hypothetical protein KM043_008239 [Ampulex compressa]|nr:hypothetical protein KM043_008239 [Ampulex compressa]
MEDAEHGRSGTTGLRKRSLRTWLPCALLWSVQETRLHGGAEPERPIKLAVMNVSPGESLPCKAAVMVTYGRIAREDRPLMGDGYSWTTFFRNVTSCSFVE